MKLLTLSLAAWLSLTATAARADADAALAAFIDREATERKLQGTIVVQRDDMPALTRSYGIAERAFGVPHRADTRYWIASITKAFTTVLVLQLRDEGKLDLDATIGTYLPAYAGRARDRVTIHHLLNHTSGLANFDTVTDPAVAIARGIPYYQLPHTSDELVARYCSGPLAHAPGTTFDYNNADYLVLGKVIEALHGKPYDVVLDERILRPLGLRDTGFLRQAAIVPRLARTYFKRDDSGALTPDLPAYPENWYAAGAMYATAADVLRFSRALVAGELITPDSLALMLKPRLDDYGYGVWSFAMKAGDRRLRVMQRPGSIMGAKATLLQAIDARATVVILANTDDADLEAMAAAVMRELVGDAPSP